MVLNLEYITTSTTMQFVFPSPVTMVKSQNKKCQNYFLSCHYEQYGEMSPH